MNAKELFQYWNDVRTGLISALDLLTDDLRMANAVRFCRSLIKLAGKGVPVYEEDTDLFLRAYRDDAQFIRICRERLQRSLACRRYIWKLLGE